MFRESSSLRRTSALIALAMVGCSSGKESSREIELSSNSLSFSAASQFASTPAEQVITVSLGEKVANLTALPAGRGIASVAVALDGRSARVTVVPAAPNSLGAGSFTGSLAISAAYCGDPTCSRLEAGQSRTVSVAYRVSSIVTDVAPTTAIAGASATVVIRGSGFNAFPPDGVMFDTTAATAITVVSDTEIRATHPALTAGTYPVRVSAPTHPDPIASDVQLTVVDSLAFTAQAASWPAPVTRVHSLAYDALRRAVFVATDAGGGLLIRHAHSDGAWHTTSVAIAALRDAALTTDGRQLLTISDSSVRLVDPETLALSEEIAAPSLPEGSHLNSLAFLNTNRAMITTAISAYTATPLYGFTTRTASLTQLPTRLYNAAAQGSANQALITLTQLDPTLSATPYVYLASASSNAIDSSVVSLNQNAVPATLDRNATRIVLNGTNVYDASQTLLGTLPTTTIAVAVSPDGRYAYTYDTTANALLRFDISVAVDEAAAFTPLGQPVPLFAAPGSGPSMIIGDDGATLFIAGAERFVIQPVPSGA